MFTINDDLSIYVTRGDRLFFTVSADDNGKPYKFQPGDVVRFKVYGKKDAETVVLQKDFPVLTVTEKVEIYLTEEETRIGEVISKPKDYWYEVELNPFDHPQTIIGYDEDGAKVFKLFPEGDEVPEYVPDPEEIPVVDNELDLTSSRPVQNQAVARAFRNLEDGYERVHSAIADKFVTPQMFGAIADGEADDTDAIRLAIANGDEVFLPAGTYVVSETIEIADFVRIRGAGKKETIIKYIGDGFLFDVKTGYSNNAVIENIRFEGDGSFLRCSNGKWGAKVVVRSVYVYGFGEEVFRFESCFNPIVEDCVIVSDGKTVFTTYDGTFAETNFTNCAFFCNVLMTGYDGNKASVMFHMENVRDTSFHKCQFENVELLLNEKNKAIGISLYNCWLENVGTIYCVGTDCSAPRVDNCNFVNVALYNADAGAIDSIGGLKVLQQKASSTSGLKTMMENPVVLDQVTVYNKDDGYSEYTPAYRIATNGTDFNHPLNKRSVYVKSANEATCNLNDMTKYSGVDCAFNILAMVVYTDDSSKMFEAKAVYLLGDYYVSDIKNLKTTSWGATISTTATETLTCTNGVLKLESTDTMKRCNLMVDFNFNQV